MTLLLTYFFRETQYCLNSKHWTLSALIWLLSHTKHFQSSFAVICRNLFLLKFFRMQLYNHKMSKTDIGKYLTDVNYLTKSFRAFAAASQCSTLSTPTTVLFGTVFVLSEISSLIKFKALLADQYFQERVNENVLKICNCTS